MQLVVQLPVVGGHGRLMLGALSRMSVHHCDNIHSDVGVGWVGGWASFAGGDLPAATCRCRGRLVHPSARAVGYALSVPIR